MTAAVFLLFGFSHGPAYERTLGRRNVAWLAAVGPIGGRALATIEILGALGLVLPMASGLVVWLTPVAALCLVVLMTFAIAFHAARREWPNIALNVVLGGLAATVGAGRWDLLGR